MLFLKDMPRTLAVLAALLLALGGTAGAAAPAEEDGGLQAAQSTVQAVTAEKLEEADLPVTQLPDVDAPYFKDFSYSSNILFSGIYKTNKFFFQVPSYWQCKYAYARIEAELSQLIEDVPASLTFMVNGNPVETYRMDYRSGGSQVFYVEIPLEYLVEGYNSFDITGYVRLYDEEGCIDDFSGANWINIRSSSFVQVGYDVTDVGGTISAYPYPYISSLDGETGSETEILVSDRCEPGELSAALLLRADLGSETALEDRITLARLSDSTGQKRHRIVVGLLENLDDHYRAAAEESAGEDSLAEGAVICYLREDDRDTLLIASQSAPALTEAASLLMDESRCSQETGSVAFVLEGASAVIQAQMDSTLEAGRLTLDSLLSGGVSFVGPFHQTADIYLPFSGGFVLADSGMVNLKFRYSENLDFTRSLVTVYWGDIPVSSKRLSRENAGGDTLPFAMPQDVVGTYAGKITVAFDLEIPDLLCTPRMDEMPWAYVTGDSSLYLPVGTGDSFSLSQRPYPFEVSSRFNQLNVVVPEEMTAPELNTLGRVIALYGENLQPYGSLHVSPADSLTTDEEKDGNLIVLGTFQDNSLIRELNSRLSFRYSDTGVRFQSNEAMILSDRYASSISTLQIFPSPYADGRAVLVVGALDDDGMENLYDFLTSAQNVWKLEKDTVLLDEAQQIRSFELAAQKGRTATPILKKMMETNREAAVFSLVAVGAMLVLLLAVILILTRIYWRQKKK